MEESPSSDQGKHVAVSPTREPVKTDQEQTGKFRPGHTGPDNENGNENDKNAIPRLVERAWAYSAWSNSTNRGRAFLSFSFPFSLSGPV